MRILGIDYGDSRCGFAITDLLNITAQGLETLNYDGNDKTILKKIDEYMEKYEIETIVVGMPFLLNGDKAERAKKTEKFIHKLKCKYNKTKIEWIDERLTTVAAHKTMNFKFEREKDVDSKKILKEVYNALLEKGYNPINQLVGYILSGDPTYITSHNDARNKIRSIERDELLEKLVKYYIGIDEQ